MASNTYNRYMWLFDTLSGDRRLTFEEINERWQESHLSDGIPLNKRTFHLHRHAVEELFSVRILCDASNGYRYYIPRDFLRKDHTRQRMIESSREALLPTERVVLRIYGPQALQVRQQPIHASQRETLTGNDYSEFTYQININSDFISTILAMCDRAEVLEPQSLRNEMKNIIRKMFNNYKK